MVKTKSFTISLNYQYLVGLLLALNVLTLLLWQPWADNGAAERTISISGEATLEAEPDEYQFNPYWQLSDDSQDEALEAATKKANAVVAKLKKLGVAEKDIKLDSNSYQIYWDSESKDENNVTVSLTIKLADKDLAQKVQDYLITTGPEGQITPWPTFSEAKQKELETAARTKAIADALAKAKQSADELGFKVGRVISVSEGTGFGDYPIGVSESSRGAEDADTKSLPILPGENEYNFTLVVVFEIK